MAFSLPNVYQQNTRGRRRKRTLCLNELKQTADLRASTYETAEGKENIKCLADEGQLASPGYAEHIESGLSDIMDVHNTKCLTVNHRGRPRKRMLYSNPLKEDLTAASNGLEVYRINVKDAADGGHVKSQRYAEHIESGLSNIMDVHNTKCLTVNHRGRPRKRMLYSNPLKEDLTAASNGLEVYRINVNDAADGGHTESHRAAEERTEETISDQFQNAVSVAETTGILDTNRNQKVISKFKQWQHLNNAAFKYDPTRAYSSILQIDIGAMSITCKFCNALKYKGEANGLCCSGGTVSLSDLPDVPEPLKSLLNGEHPQSNEFYKNIRKYNSSFQMTSFGTSIPIPQSRGFMPTFKIQGQVYHKAGSLIPLSDEEHKFLQIYFLGNNEKETNRRCSIIPGTNKTLIQSLQNMLHVNNHFVRQFKMALDCNPSDNLRIVIKADKKPATGHQRVYNEPMVDEVAVIIAGNEFEKRDIVLTMRSNEYKKISETHIAYDALQYPLMFPRGEDGYAINIKKINPGTKLNVAKCVSAMEFYAYRLMIRHTENRILNYRQLLHQYLVDMYAKIESERLLYIRLNQKKLRVDNYIHLKDAIAHDSSAANLGKLVILPSTYVGSPRNMHEYAQDGMTFVRYGGKPSLFITFTFNPKCKELDANLILRQKRTDRHDLVARIFRQKLIKMMKVLTKGEVFGPVKYWLYSVEWQKRGLPHAHILLWLIHTLNPNEIDDIISAEIPDQTKDKELYDIVVNNMIHGPCGALNWQSPCMKEKVCCKRFPRQFNKETQTGNDGYPLYRRRKPEDGGNTAVVRLNSQQVRIDNRWVVPYSPLLLKMFSAHINVECCNSVKSVKYILKYIHKGTDQGVFTTERENGDIDEIAEYQVGRYISSNEAAWRIFGFPIHEKFPMVLQLDVHLENGQRIYFSESNLENIINNTPKNTTLTAFFALCRSDDFAKTLLYCEVPKYYTWDKSNRVFRRRKQGARVEGYPELRSADALGRVYTVNLRNFECYYLRLLLHKIRGPTSFKYLRTVDGVEHGTFHAACLAYGLLQNDNQWEETLQEATSCDSAAKIRNLFAIILSFCEPSNPRLLWQNHKDSMSEDTLKRLRQINPESTILCNSDIYNESLLSIEDKVIGMIGKKLSDIGMDSPSREGSVIISKEMLRELAYDPETLMRFISLNEPMLNTDQQVIYVEVFERIMKNEGGVIFIDAPGGTGKTFLINLLLARVRTEKKIALAVASSGIAATLMSGGRTAHSVLQIPIDLIHNETPVCNITKGSAMAKVLLEASALFWDEISMMHKHGFEAVNRTLQDIRGNRQVMGGLVVVIAGDFRQTLPVIPRGTMYDEINACLKSSHLWCNVKILKLTLNMRVQQSNEYDSKLFSDYLLSIGNGKVPVNKETGKIHLTDKFSRQCPTLTSLIESVYPDIKLNIKNSKWLEDRAILAPLNSKVEEINNNIQSTLLSPSRTYFSIDMCIDQEEATNYPVEFLNSLQPNGLPPHKLEVKIGSPVMLLRNLDPPKLCNGSRLTVKACYNYVIEATILNGPFEGVDVFIPMIPLISNDLPFSFKRLQFPLRLAFAITINKSQGQSFKTTGLDLTSECFSHGQLYVGMSRSKDPNQLFILTNEYEYTKNVVYRQVLED